jgi:RimJ/RimL family protein N-acetyltransferase
MVDVTIDDGDLLPEGVRFTAGRRRRPAGAPARTDLPDANAVSPVRTGRHTRVRPVAPDDYEWLFKVALHTPAGSRWRLHGAIPTYEQFMATMLAGAKATCVIEDAAGDLLGMVQLWHHDELSRHAQLTAFLSPDAEGRGWPLEGVLLFVDYAFAAYDLRKLYVEALEPELESYRSLVGTVLREEGRLRDHQYLFGRYVDGYLLAMYRPDFAAFFDRVVGARQAGVPAAEPTESDNQEGVS